MSEIKWGGKGIFPSRRTTTSNMSDPSEFLPTNIHSVCSHRRSWCSKPPYGTTYWERLLKTKWLPLVNLANIRMTPGVSHLSVNQRPQQLFIRNRQCARHALRLHFLSSCPQKRACGSFWSFRPNTTNESRQPATKIYWHSWEWERWEKPETGFLWQFKTQS